MPIHRADNTIPKKSEHGKWYTIDEESGSLLKHKDAYPNGKKNKNANIIGMSCIIPYENPHYFPIKSCFIMQMYNDLPNGLKLIYERVNATWSSTKVAHMLIISIRKMDWDEYRQLIEQIKWLPCEIKANGLPEKLDCLDDDMEELDYEISEIYMLMKYLYETTTCYVERLIALEIHTLIHDTKLKISDLLGCFAEHFPDIESEYSVISTKILQK